MWSGSRRVVFSGWLGVWPLTQNFAPPQGIKQRSTMRSPRSETHGNKRALKLNLTANGFKKRSGRNICTEKKRQTQALVNEK